MHVSLVNFTCGNLEKIKAQTLKKHLELAWIPAWACKCMCAWACDCKELMRATILGTLFRYATSLKFVTRFPFIDILPLLNNIVKYIVSNLKLRCFILYFINTLLFKEKIVTIHSYSQFFTFVNNYIVFLLASS